MSERGGFHVDPLFIAVPELTFNIQILEYLLANGYISNEQYDRFINARRAGKKADRLLGAAMHGAPLIRRLMAVGSELLTISTVDILRGAGLITEVQGHAIRIAIRSLNASVRGGLPADRAQIFSRLMRLLGVQISQEHIDLLRGLGIISAQEADRYRGYLRSGRGIEESLSKARRAKSLLDALMILGQIPINAEVINGMVASGILTPRLGRVYNSLVAYGVKQWKVFDGARAAAGWRARAMLMLTGSMNAQLLDFLLDAKIITRSQWVNMQLLEIAARQINDHMLEKLTARRFRVKPGEAPIKTFARAARINEGDLLRLLADASREASKEAAALAGSGIGKSTRARQYDIAARQLHIAMRNMWDGVGYLTIWGERRTAEAAAESVYAMQKGLLTGRFAQLGDALTWQAKAGIDSYISREENTLPLSRRVYKNMKLYQGEVDKRIKLSLLQGKSPLEIADDIRKYISPNVRGGVSYAAMRLARTEINNAFHLSTIRYTRENPWVRGYEWHLSGSHGRPDVCNDYASEDHDGLGPGVFKKANVPGKPHPHCLCYITVAQMSEAEFLAAFQAGRFDRHLSAIERGQAYSGDQPSSADLKAYARDGYGNLKENLSNQ